MRCDGNLQAISSTPRIPSILHSHSVSTRSDEWWTRNVQRTITWPWNRVDSSPRRDSSGANRDRFSHPHLRPCPLRWLTIIYYRSTGRVCMATASSTVSSHQSRLLIECMGIYSSWFELVFESFQNSFSSCSSREWLHNVFSFRIHSQGAEMLERARSMHARAIPTIAKVPAFQLALRVPGTVREYRWRPTGERTHRQHCDQVSAKVSRGDILRIYQKQSLLIWGRAQSRWLLNLIWSKMCKIKINHACSFNGKDLLTSQQACAQTKVSLILK